MARTQPDRASLEIAHRKLRPTASLDDMLKTPALARVLDIVARDHIQRRSRPDVKKLQANDND
nr:hypothetical protein [uncultured Massilia sp.]